MEFATNTNCLASLFLELRCPYWPELFCPLGTSLDCSLSDNWCFCCILCNYRSFPLSLMLWPDLEKVWKTFWKWKLFCIKLLVLRKLWTFFKEIIEFATFFIRNVHTMCTFCIKAFKQCLKCLPLFTGLALTPENFRCTSPSLWQAFSCDKSVHCIGSLYVSL